LAGRAFFPIEKLFRIHSKADRGFAGREADTGELQCGVHIVSKSNPAGAVAAAAAHDLNEELTVILNSISLSIRAIEPGHPARPLLLDLRSAAQRCAWTASGLLNFTARQGVRPSSISLERMIERV